MTAVDLRPATWSDYSFAFRVHCAAMRPSVEPIFGWDERFQARYFRLHFNPAQRQIIRFAGVDVGIFSVEEQEESLFLALIAILPRYQQLGIGTTLIRGLQREARERGFPVTLRVLKSNHRARALYKRLGFALTGETDTHYQMEWSEGARTSQSGPNDHEEGDA
jgi:GNAT superfamily N-acetyltransferase